ncbi:MAG: aminotransferase class I/II-fold pyridoxal phosphate-dependent enzyme, partial [Candidatus Omnitrophota bacterium]
MLDFIDNELEEIRRAGLYRSLKCVDGQQGARVTVDGRASLNLCSNNYLGLANDPRLMKASIAAIERYGVGTGASRLVCGNLRLHEQLEERLARFKHQKAALVFNSGYAANTGTIAALAGRDDIIFSDKLNHASIVDGIILSRAEFVRYPHRDMAALEKALQQTAASRKKIIITDTVFSMDGDT